MNRERGGIPDYGAADHVLLFGLLAKAVCEALGEPGEDIVREAVIRYGLQRGGRMRRRAEKDGLPICTATYLLYPGVLSPARPVCQQNGVE